jgi:hypothetical protein
VSSPQTRPVLFLLLALLLVWIAAAAAYVVFKNSKMTAAKVELHLREIDWGKLSAAERAEVLRRLMAEINSLSTDERQKYRLDGEWRALFNEMNDEEKSAFIEGTMPSGFKQVLATFEQLSPEKRQRTIDETLKHLREDENGKNEPDTNALALSPALQQKMVSVGLKSFYTQSSAQSKAELAPVLEEMQRMMEKGTLFRGGN